jgi:pimeloyl-ACP methyl ester carboxylesterase
MPAQVSELKVRNVPIRLHRAGRGPTVLFLHGAGGVPQWLPFFDALAEHYELLVPEHPGFGGSADPPWIHSMADLAMFYLDLVEEAGLDRAHLIGNSLGGWLAAEILIRDRSRFKSLVQGVVTLNNHKEQLVKIDAVKPQQIPARVQPYLGAKI